MRVLKEMTRRARLLRNKPTAAEAMLWAYLRKGRLMRYKFRRQHVVQKYNLDFFCPAVSLGIELDGEVHDEQKEHDMFRSDGLSELGIQILRFSNERVLTNVEAGRGT
jgi:leucyl-tRNA synthetase